MVVADGEGIPLAISLHLASPNEQTHVEETLKGLRKLPRRLIADRGYDSEPLRIKLRDRGIDLIAPVRRCKFKSIQDGRKLKRYRHRWKIERTMAWLSHYRRLVTRWEVHHQTYEAFVKITCALITYRYL